MSAVKNSPIAIVVSAPSGAGKTTLCKNILTHFSSRIQLSISTTTRAPRGQEVHGKEYFFKSIAEFESEISTDAFLEWAQVHGNYYGTSKAFVEDTFRKGQSVLLDIDVQGARSIRDRLGVPSTLLLFVAPPSLEVLEERLRNRGTDSEASIQKRMANARAEMAERHRFDHVIINQDLNQATDEILRIIQSRL